MGLHGPPGGEVSQVEAFTAADVKDIKDIKDSRDIKDSKDGLPEGAQEEIAVAGFQEPPPGEDGFFGIAGLLRAPVLRLKQVAVAAAGDVEGMPPWAVVCALFPGEGLAAAADRAEEGDHGWGEYGKAVLLDSRP
jgi:hypothetical protein